MSRQKGKGYKRRKSWHRGRAEAERWVRTRLPEVDSGANPTDGTPNPLRRQGRQNRGDAA